MIRFSCPGCPAVYSVEDDKAGKSGKCPKCQAGFTIPNALSVEQPPPLPPPPSAEPEPIEIAPCPRCESRLSVMPGDLGLEVECPNCKAQYIAKRPSPPSPIPATLVPVPTANPSRRDDYEEWTSTRKKRFRRDRDDDDDDRESRIDSNQKPGNLTAVAIMLLVGGIQACVMALALAASCYGLAWPGTYYSVVFGILAIVRAAEMLGQKDRKPPPRTQCIMQIICVVNCDVLNLAMGIVGLVLLNNEEVVRYYRKRGITA